MNVTATLPLVAPPRRFGRQGVAAALLAVVAVGALGILVLWWQAPSTHAVHNTADLLVGLGRATGMLGAYLLLVEVALMARVPWVERQVGTDVLAGAHRWIGTYLFGLVVVHVTTTIAGYAEGERVGLWRETRTLVLGYPYVLLAAVSLFLLALVVGLSLRPVRQLLPYELWHYLHLLAYVAIGLALAHQVVDGLQFTGHRVAAHAWVAAHAVVLVTVLRFRVVEPLRLWLRHDFRVSHVTHEADGSVNVFVTGRALDEIPVLAGQFFRWRFLTGRSWWEAHPFSLSQEPTGQWLRMTAKPVGDHTATLHRLRPGVPVLLEGPYGAVTPSLRRGRRILLVAAGSGVAPLLALAQAGARSGVPVNLVYRVRDEADICFGAELDELRRTGSADVQVVIGRRSRPDVRRFMNVELAELLRLADVDVYLCGPEGFVADVRRRAQAAGVARGRLHTESFAW